MISPTLVRRVSKASGVAFRPGSTSDLARLQALGAPPDVLAFYRKYEPADCAEIAQARLWPIQHVLEENSDYVPGAYLHPRGFVVIGTTEFGDVYCLDLSDPGPPVVLMSHELLYDELSLEEIRALRKPVAATFEEFVGKFADGAVDLEPLT